jgi:hypothetical protein
MAVGQSREICVEWATSHNSLLIITFDECDDVSEFTGLTDARSDPAKGPPYKDIQNHIPTIFAGAHVKHGYLEAKKATHVNILRTIEAMYGLPKSGMQQDNALQSKISDDPITGVFEPVR